MLKMAAEYWNLSKMKNILLLIFPESVCGKIVVLELWAEITSANQIAELFNV